jgi:hypothetical protein
MLEYLKEKNNELDRNSKIHGVRGLHRGIHEFKEHFQPRCNFVMSEKSLMQIPAEIRTTQPHYLSLAVLSLRLLLKV